MEKTGHLDMCEVCCPLLVSSGAMHCISQLTLRLRFSPFEMMSPAGVEGKSCFIDGIDDFKEQHVD